jgi:hypothetical protein
VRGTSHGAGSSTRRSRSLDEVELLYDQWRTILAEAGEGKRKSLRGAFLYPPVSSDLVQVRSWLVLSLANLLLCVIIFFGNCDCIALHCGRVTQVWQHEEIQSAFKNRHKFSLDVLDALDQ